MAQVSPGSDVDDVLDAEALNNILSIDSSASQSLLKKYVDSIPANIAEDHTGEPVYLAASQWQLEHALDDVEGVTFRKTKELGAH